MWPCSLKDRLGEVVAAVFEDRVIPWSTPTHFTHLLADNCSPCGHVPIRRAVAHVSRGRTISLSLADMFEHRPILVLVPRLPQINISRYVAVWYLNIRPFAPGLRGHAWGAWEPWGPFMQRVPAGHMGRRLRQVNWRFSLFFFPLSGAKTRAFLCTAHALSTVWAHLIDYNNRSGTVNSLLMTTSFTNGRITLMILTKQIHKQYEHPSSSP